MPLTHLTPPRAGRRLLVGGLLTAVAVLGTPAVASAADGAAIPSLPIPVPGTSTSTTTATTSPTTTSSAIPAGPFEAGAACVRGAVAGVQMVFDDASGSLLDYLLDNQDLLEGLLAAQGGELADAVSGDAVQEAAAAGQETITVPVEIVMNGVTQLVDVVVTLIQCLVDAVPTGLPAAETPVVPAYTGTPTTSSPPAVTTSAAPVAAVAYPGYAPTGGAPTEGSSAPLVLGGLGLLTAAAGGVAHHLRARRGVTD